jgi:hypothetical protein
MTPKIQNVIIVLYYRDCEHWDSCRGQGYITCFGCNGHGISEQTEFINNKSSEFKDLINEWLIQANEKLLIQTQDLE